MKFFLLLLGVFGLIASANAQHEVEGKEAHIPNGPHHLSILLADTRIDGEGDNSTLGIDYEYRVSPLIGLGAVIEHAYGELDATTLLAVADIHIYEGFTMQVGPGLSTEKVKMSSSHVPAFSMSLSMKTLLCRHNCIGIFTRVRPVRWSLGSQ